MRNIFNIVLALFFSGLSGYAQNDNYIKKPSLAFYFSFFDFNGADYLRSNSLSDAIKNKKLTDINGMDFGFSIGYLKGISKHFDFAATLAGTSTNYPARPNDGTTLGDSKLLLEADASVVGKMLSDEHFFTPFFKVGVGASKYMGYYGAFIPVGVGFQFKISPDEFMLFNWQYRLPVTEMVNYHFYYSLGFATSLARDHEIKAVIPPPPPPVVEAPKDTDGDGVVDSLDACPNVAGLPQFKGCPDTDGDGIPDKDDKCPTVAGVARYNGCPIPDTDGDGVNDEEDKCPAVPGVKENQGCPLVKEEVLKKISYDAKNIFFASGSSKLLPKSFKPLSEVAKILKEDVNLKLDIEGHTDNTGKPEKNQALSENRAKAVLDYLTAKGGVDAGRLASAGYGDTKPTASNKTAKGKAQNRRVELKLKYY